MRGKKMGRAKGTTTLNRKQKRRVENMERGKVERINVQQQVRRVKRLIDEGRVGEIKLRKCPIQVALLLRENGIEPEEVMVESHLEEEERYRTKGLTEEEKKERRRKGHREKYKRGLIESVKWKGEWYKPGDEGYDKAIEEMEMARVVKEKALGQAERVLERLRKEKRDGEVKGYEAAQQNSIDVHSTSDPHDPWTGGRKELEPDLLRAKEEAAKEQSREWLKQRRRKRKTKSKPMD